MTDQPPTDRRYSHLYMPRENLLPDSARARVRLATYLTDTVSHDRRVELATAMQGELGIPVAPWFPTFYDKVSITDVLDSVTIVHRYFKLVNRHNDAEGWLRAVARIFHEENLGYRVDAAAGVHPLVDVEFEAQRVAAIQVLTGPRYKATLDAFEGAHEALERDPPDTKEAVRDIFGAIENLFKLMAPKAARLGAGELKQHLQPIIDQHYAEITAKRAATKMVLSLGDWVDGGHHYRHEPGTPDPAPPPMDYAVMTMSTGAGFLRWLAEIDRALNP
jgi:hypothetical protein